MSNFLYIQDLWRPTGPSGCYSLVGFNRPVGSEGEDGVLNPLGVNDDPLDRCVVLPVTEDQQIEVQSGDVVGYYVDHPTAPIAKKPHIHPVFTHSSILPPQEVTETVTTSEE